MSKFKNIQKQLSNLALQLNAKLSIDRRGYPDPISKFEERRIDWIEEGINKALIIQPTFELSGVNSDLWSFTIIAWDTTKVGTRKNAWKKDLIHKQNFASIEQSIDRLLETGLSELNRVTSTDLEPIQGIYLILDLDGVLITTPNWKQDEIEEDGYSKFNSTCVDNLNKLLLESRFQIWLSSSRRQGKSLAEFNQIFLNRKINNRIIGFLPVYEDCKNRKEEIERFISENDVTKFLILDDDKSLNSLEDNLKSNLVLTKSLIGFKEDAFNEACRRLKKEHNTE